MATLLPLFTSFVWLCVPGYLALTALRARIPFRLGAAPAVSAALLSIVGLACEPLGIRWGPVSAAVGISLAIAILWAVVAMVDPRRAHRVRGVRWAGNQTLRVDEGSDEHVHMRASHALWRRNLDFWPLVLSTLGVIVVALVYLLPIAGGGMKLTSISSAFDAVFHYNGVAFIRSEGSAAPWTALQSMYGSQPTFYPVGFHIIASLVAGAPVVAANATMFVALCLSGSGFVSLCWLVVPEGFARLRSAIVIAALIPSCTLFFSIASMSLLTGLWPNAFAGVVFPGVVAAILSAFTRRGGGVERDLPWALSSLLPAVLAVLGGVAIHTSTVFAVGLVVWSLLAAHAVVTWRANRGRAIALMVFLALAVAGFEFVGMTTLRSMALTPKIEMNTVAKLLTLIADRPRITAVRLKTSYVLGVYFLAGIGIVFGVLRRSHSRMRIALIIMLGVTFIVALGTAYSFLPLSSLANPWYQARERVLPMMMTALIPLAVTGACHAIAWLEEKGRMLGSAFLALLIVASVSGAVLNGTRHDRVPKLVELASDSSDGYFTNTVSADEREFIEETASRLDHDAVVLGDPRSGASLYWALGGVKVVFPHLGRPTLDRDILLAKRADEFSSDPAVCRALIAHGPRVYLYEDHTATKRKIESQEDVKEGDFRGLENFPAGSRTLVAKSGNGDYELTELRVNCTPNP